MSQNPLLLLCMIGAAGYIGWLWWHDMRAAQAGKPLPQALPGATMASRKAIGIACLGSIGLLAAETLGEYQLGIVGEQSNMTLLFALNSLGAAIIEELIFRGYLVINGRSNVVRWLGIIGASALFALLHPFLWQWEETFTLTLTLKGIFSTVAAFAFSLWFYIARFAPWNPRQSLLPCIAGHAIKNLGVIAIKGAQGFLTGWW
jgi:uncharacterized protein